jgi:hypothetical protein
MDTLSNKQDTLLMAGDNITIVDYVISSNGEVSQADLDGYVLLLVPF